jgi:hypothetical protein
MNKQVKREIRASTVASAAGVGAVIDVGVESFVVPGIDRWRQSSLRAVTLPRLSSRLNRNLKTTSDVKPWLEVRRFPRAMFCERCRKITFWRPELEKQGQEPSCTQPSCAGALVPMRFVVACENGHLDDFNWGLWAHSGANASAGCRSRDKLTFTVDEKAATGGLASLVVGCEVCSSSRSLEEITARDSNRHLLGKCSCRHPWVFGSQGNCDAVPEVLQRGATNLHYPVTISALDIPDDLVLEPLEEFSKQIMAHTKYDRLKHFVSDTEGANREFVELLAETIAMQVGCHVRTVLDVVKADIDDKPVSANTKANNELDQNILLNEEWKTILLALREGGILGQNFRARPEALDDNAPLWARRLIEGVVLVERLREVRAYRGFQRVKPGGPERTVPPDVAASESWLPCTEVFGEGVALAFHLDRLTAWSAALPEKELRALQQLEQKRLDENFWFLPKVEPVFMALHALSHLLLRRITFECGYSSSSLRERLYFDLDQGSAGVMIYTADADSEGSLGGLVRQGQRDRLAQTLYEAAEQGRWCSADPVCSETAGQGLGGFNRAACHACLLVSETSCTCANTVLDRRLLLNEKWGLLTFLEQNA